MFAIAAVLLFLANTEDATPYEIFLRVGVVACVGEPHERLETPGTIMPEITLLSSVHAENGKCSANALCQILEYLAPDVLFQEVPYFEYLRQSEEARQHPAAVIRLSERPKPLEITAIAHYLSKRQLLQVPVDSLGRSTTQAQQHSQVADWVLHTEPELRHLLDRIQEYEGKHGFACLNSLRHHKVVRQIDAAFMNALRARPNPTLSEYYSSWKGYNAKREKAMIQNIVDFSTKESYGNAVFLFGAAHRQGLIREIQKVKKTLPIRIEWKLFR